MPDRRNCWRGYGPGIGALKLSENAHESLEVVVQRVSWGAIRSSSSSDLGNQSGIWWNGIGRRDGISDRDQTDFGLFGQAEQIRWATAGRRMLVSALHAQPHPALHRLALDRDSLPGPLPIGRPTKEFPGLAGTKGRWLVLYAGQS